MTRGGASLGLCAKFFLPKKARTDASVAASHLTGRPGRPRNAANRRGPGDPPHHHHRLVGHDPGPGVA
jgi:hypothetical protein